MLKLNSKYGDETPFFSSKPCYEELKVMSVGQLITIATHKRYNRKSFKDVLIKYIMDLGDLKL